MNPTTEQVLQEALALPEAERLELTEALIAAESREKSLPFDPSWLAEIERRSAEVDAGLMSTTSWAETRQRVLQRLRERQGD